MDRLHEFHIIERDSSKRKNVYEMLSSVNLERKEYELRMFFCAVNFRNRELRMVQKTLETCLSETHASENREV